MKMRVGMWVKMRVGMRVKMRMNEEESVLVLDADVNAEPSVDVTKELSKQSSSTIQSKIVDEKHSQQRTTLPNFIQESLRVPA